MSLYVLVASVYAEDLRPRLFAMEAAAWVVPAMVGPFLAGIAVDHVTWRALFLTLAPAVIGSALLLGPAIRNAPRERPASKPLAPIGRWTLAIPAALGLAAIQLAGQRLAWTTIVLAPIGVATLAVVLPRLLPRGVFSARAGIPVVVLCRGLINGAYNGIVAYLPLMLVSTHRYTPTEAGLPLTLGTLGWAAASWLQSRTNAGSNTLRLRIGFALLAVAGIALAHRADQATPGQ